MTVAELIEKLKDFPQDKNVCVWPESGCPDMFSYPKEDDVFDNEELRSITIRIN